MLKIISGGQTGADRAGLDFAIENRIPHGGWCPKGRKAEDGAIPAPYELKETPKADYPQRTEWNITASDGTVIFSISAKLSGGSAKTLDLARKHQKPVLHVAEENREIDPAEALRKFIAKHKIEVLNVAGPRASKEPHVALFVKQTLSKALLEP